MELLELFLVVSSQHQVYSEESLISHTVLLSIDPLDTWEQLCTEAW